MLSALNYAISLKKWQNKKPGGQIATLLLVVIVAILIFILVTVNLGALSITSTQLSNAADKAGFYLGSQLASRSNTLYKSLGNKVKKCWKKGGFFSFGSLLAVIMAVAAIAIAFYAPPLAPMMIQMGTMGPVAAGAVGGMIGGAIGGGIDGSGALMGAIRGAQIGAAVGGIASGAGLGIVRGAATTTTAGVGAGSTFTSPVFTGVGGIPTSGPVFTGVGGMPIGVGSSLAGTGTVMTTAGPIATGVGGMSTGIGFSLAGTGTVMTTAGPVSTGVPGIGLSGTNPGFFSGIVSKISNSPLGKIFSFGKSTIGSPVGKIATGSLSIGRQAYSSISADANLSNTLSALARSLSGLPEYERYREGAFLQALSETIDDPRTLADGEDIDGDGNTEERIPYFSWWWQKRQNKNGEIIPILTERTRSFIEGPFTNFDTQAKSKYTCSQPPGELVRKEECAKGDGLVIDLARVLKDWGYAVSFWKPGLPPPGPDEDCDNQNNCVGQDYDAVETVVSELKDFNTAAEIVDRDEESGQVTNIPALTSTWKNWIKIFYRTDDQGKHIAYELVGAGKGDFIREQNGGYRYVGQGYGDYERNDDFYNSFGTVINSEDLNNNGIYGEDAIVVGNGEVVDELKGLSRWKQDFEGIRRKLPDCQYCYMVNEFEICTESPQPPPQVSYPIYIKNPPCKDNINPITRVAADFGSTDQDLADEFTPVQEKLDASIQEVQNSRASLENYFEDMTWISTTNLSGWGGTNPITYSWNDSRGSHSVLAEVGPFKIPWIKKKKSKKKICLILRDYQDDGSSTWIRITRQDPANKDIGLLGKWNPNIDGKIEKIDRVSFSYDHIDIGGTK